MTPNDLVQNPILLQPIITATATLVGVFIGATATFLSPLILNLYLQNSTKRRSNDLFIEELSDLIRHCKSNVEIIDNIDASKGTPARMHFDKMKMFETALVFDNEIVRYLPSEIRKRCIWIRINIRNLNSEISDIVSYFYGKQFREPAELSARLSYMKDKFIYAQLRFQFDLDEVSGSKNKIKPESRKDIIYISSTYE